MRIMIVDDDPIVCQSLQTIIELSAKKEGLARVAVVATGQSGEKAIALYQKERPDILLLDIQMAGLDGLTAARQILAEDPAAKILFLTTFLDEEYILEALRLGARGYLMKSAAGNILPALLAVEGGQRVYGEEIVDCLPRMLDRSGKNRQQTDEKPSCPEGIGGSGAGTTDGPSSAGRAVDPGAGTTAGPSLEGANFDPRAGESGRPDATVKDQAMDPAAFRRQTIFADLSEREWELVKLVAQGQNNREIAASLHFSEGTIRNYLSQILEKIGLRDRTQLAIRYYKEGF